MRLGGRVVHSATVETTHLVANSVLRTVKFLTALAFVQHVVTSEWIEQSGLADHFQGIWCYLYIFMELFGKNDVQHGHKPKRPQTKTATNQNGHMIMVISEHVNKYLSLNKLGIIKSRTETMPEVGFKRNALH